MRSKAARRPWLSCPAAQPKRTVRICGASPGERTGYPTQKPLGIMRRIIAVHTDPGDCVLDFFAGSGTTGDAARLAGRQFCLVDNHPPAIRTMTRRLGLKAS